jgi:hypothetical protein
VPSVAASVAVSAAPSVPSGASVSEQPDVSEDEGLELSAALDVSVAELSGLSAAPEVSVAEPSVVAVSQLSAALEVSVAELSELSAPEVSPDVSVVAVPEVSVVPEVSEDDAALSEAGGAGSSARAVATNAEAQMRVATSAAVQPRTPGNRRPFEPGVWTPRRHSPHDGFSHRSITSNTSDARRDGQLGRRDRRAPMHDGEYQAQVEIKCFVGRSALALPAPTERQASSGACMYVRPLMMTRNLWQPGPPRRTCRAVITTCSPIRKPIPVPSSRPCRSPSECGRARDAGRSRPACRFSQRQAQRLRRFLRHARRGSRPSSPAARGVASS